MNDTWYLVDNNALIALTARRVRTDYFRAHCRLTSDVVWEAREHPDSSLLAQLALGFSALTIEHIRHVMGTVEPADVSLINLYRNSGAADPGLVAAILEARVAEDGMLFPDEWALVTNDAAVTEKAREFEIPSISAAQLAALIDDAPSAQGPTYLT